MEWEVVRGSGGLVEGKYFRMDNTHILCIIHSIYIFFFFCVFGLCCEARPLHRSHKILRDQQPTRPVSCLLIRDTEVHHWTAGQVFSPQAVRLCNSSAGFCFLFF